jgi:hypothetical protein
VTTTVSIVAGARRKLALLRFADHSMIRKELKQRIFTDLDQCESELKKVLNK